MSTPVTTVNRNRPIARVWSFNCLERWSVFGSYDLLTERGRQGFEAALLWNETHGHHIQIIYHST